MSPANHDAMVVGRAIAVQSDALQQLSESETHGGNVGDDDERRQ